MIDALRLFVLGLGIAGYSCGGVRPPNPVPTPTPPPLECPELGVPWCHEAGVECGACKHQPPGEACPVMAAPCPTPEPPTPTPTPPPGTGCTLSGAGPLLGDIPQPVIDSQGHTLGWLVNDVISKLVGCEVGSRCIITARPQVWQAAVEEALRQRGVCAGQHESGTDEIAVSVEPGKPMFGYHIYAGAGWDDPTASGTIVWSPGADRPAYAPPGGVPVPPTPAPEPPIVPGACPVEPCPIRLWAAETLPPGWGPNEIGRPAYEVKAIPHTMGNADASVVVIRQLAFCEATGQSPDGNGNPRAACPMRLPGSGKDHEQVAVEAWILFGGFTRDGRHGQDCTPNHTSNPAAFLMGTGNCRMCSASLALRDDPRSCSEWF